MTPYEIPLRPEAQQFQIQMAGVLYTLRTTWNPISSCWLLDILAADETPIMLSLPIQPGVDMLKQFPHLGLPGQMWVQVDGAPFDAPGVGNLGTSGHLYYLAP